MNPTTETISRSLLNVFRTTESTTEGRWEELRAFTLLALRSERDAGMEIGRSICGRMVRDIDSMVNAFTLVMSTDPDNYKAGPAVDSKKVLKQAVSTRKMAKVLPVGISSAIEKNNLAIATELMTSGIAQTNIEDFIEMMEGILDAWDDLEQAVDGARNLTTSLDSLPTNDLTYFSRRISDWIMRGAWDIAIRGRNDEAIFSTLSSAVFARLALKKVSPDLVIASGTGYQGKCDPAQVTGKNSGPFGIVGSTSTLVYITEQAVQQQISIPSRSATVIYLPTTQPDGFYYVPGINTQIAYTLRMAANTYPYGTITLQFVQSGVFGIISAEDLRDAINAANVAGVLAAVEVEPLSGNKRVRIDCLTTGTVRVFGPASWVRFYSFSDPLLVHLGFPSLVFPNQIDTAGSVAALINATTSMARATSETRVLARGLKATAGYPVPYDISISKGTWACSIQDEKIVPNDPVALDSVEVGDECYLIVNNTSTPAVVTEVEGNGFHTDPVPDSGVLSYTLNPQLHDYDSSVGVTMVVDGRMITSPTVYHDNLGVMYIENKTHQYYLGQGSITGPFQIIQDIIKLSSRDTTTASLIQVSSGSSLDVELGFGYTVKRATAYEVVGSFTEKDGFQSSVRVGDFILQGNVKHYITGTNKGYVQVSPGFEVTGQTPSLDVYNAPLYAWNQLLTSLSLPSFDSAKARRLLYSMKIGKNVFKQGSELVQMLQGLQGTITLRTTIQAFISESFSANQLRSCLLPLKQTADLVYDGIERGDLSVLSLPAREISSTGSAAVKSADGARSVKLNLSMIEYLAMGLGD